jgi:hypothetical protein
MDGPSGKQSLVVTQLKIAHGSACAWRRSASCKQIANDCFDGHRRDEGTVITFRQQMPGPGNSGAKAVDTFDCHEHATPMLAPTQAAGCRVHQRRQSRQ